MSLSTVSLTMHPDALLTWMFVNKSSIDKILKMHKRTLQIVYNESFFWKIVVKLQKTELPSQKLVENVCFL